MDLKDYAAIILDNQDVLCYISDVDTYELLYLNKAAMEAFDVKTPEEYRGKKCYKLMQGKDSPCSFCTNAKLKSGEKFCWEYYNDKIKKYVYLEDTLVEVNGKLRRLEICRDITEHREEMQALRSKITIEETLIKCIETLNRGKDTDKAVNSLLESICEFYAANRAYIFEFDFDKQVTNNTYEWCEDGVTKEIDNLQEIPIEVVSDWIKKFEEVGEFYISSLDGDLDHDAADYKILEAQGIRSLMAAPLLKEGEIIGFLGVDDPARNMDDKTLLKSITFFILDDLEKRRMIQQMKAMSYLDGLTGVYNRNRYVETLEMYEENPPAALGIVFLDINGMKAINDSYGHSYGDRIIHHAGKILKEYFGEKVFRLGGDEFLVLCENVEQDSFEANVEKLRRFIAQDEECSMAIGAVWKDGTFNPQEEINKTDSLMYEEKKSFYSTAERNRRRRDRI
ncbi:MAG: sensor domain-containing diguanylate cyclase [Bacillota bacterium]|nr:sensor domain-containing diguanylate cyclase [Bacillota bacterium]